jgi:hypothetical protein
MKILIMYFSATHLTSSLFSPDVLLSTQHSNTLNLCSLLNVRDQVSYPYSITGKIVTKQTISMKLTPFLTDSHLCSYSRTFQHFMEPEVSLPCSQEPSNWPYPEPDQSSLYCPILSLQNPSSYYPFTCVLVFLVVCFLLISTNNLYAFLFSPICAICPAHPILLDFTILVIHDKE